MSRSRLRHTIRSGLVALVTVLALADSAPATAAPPPGKGGGGGGANGYLNAITINPSIPSASTKLRSRDIALEARRRRRQVSFTGTVLATDENLGAISGESL